MACCRKIGGLLRGQFQDQATLPAYEGEKLAIHLQAVAPEHPVTFNAGGAQQVLGQMVQHGLGGGPNLSSVDAGIRRLRQRLTAGVHFSFHGPTVGMPARADNSLRAVSMGSAEYGASMPNPRRRIFLASTAVGLVILVVGILLPVVWTDSYPIRSFSASMAVAGAGIGLAGMSVSRIQTAGTRAREFTFIGGGMIGMAMLVIGLLTLVEVARPV